MIDLFLFCVLSTQKVLVVINWPPSNVVTSPNWNKNLPSTLDGFTSKTLAGKILIPLLMTLLAFKLLTASGGPQL